jgi:hypothetical protein
MFAILLLSTSCFSFGACFSSTDGLPFECRFPQGDSWCLENADNKVFAYADACLQQHRTTGTRQSTSAVSLETALKKINDGQCCHINLIKVVNGEIAGQQRKVALYGVEGCGCGNAWWVSVSVLDMDNNEVDSWGEGIFGFSPDDVAIRRGAIILTGMDYAPDDARCCPSIEKTQILALVNGKLLPTE